MKKNITRLENNLLNYESKYSLSDGTLINNLGVTDKDKLEDRKSVV